LHSFLKSPKHGVFFIEATNPFTSLSRHPLGVFSFESIRAGDQPLFMMDVRRGPPYLEGLLNRMAIKAIAASLFIRDVNKNHGAWARRMPSLCN
jgi:hypothetical protein